MSPERGGVFGIRHINRRSGKDAGRNGDRGSPEGARLAAFPETGPGSAGEAAFDVYVKVMEEQVRQFV